MDRWVGKVAVVTGASAGIGKAISEKLVKSGIVTVGVSRRLDRLEAVKENLKHESGSFHPKKCDVTKEEELIATFRAIKDELGPIHILVNNAGVVISGKICGEHYLESHENSCFHKLLTKLSKNEFYKYFKIKMVTVEQRTEVWRSMFETNVIALCVATREAVSMMREHNIAGHVVHINSIAGHKVPVFEEPEQAAYPASKHAVTALTEILRQEMNFYKTGIKVTSISPGYTANTEIFGSGNSRFEGSSLPALQPEHVADAVYYTLSTPPNVQVSELTIKAIGEKF